MIPTFIYTTAKTCLYGLKILENIEIGHFFQFRAFFHLSSNLHTSCLSAIYFFPKIGKIPIHIIKDKN